MSMRSPYPDVEIPEVSLTEFLFADGFGDRADAPAFLDGTTGDQLTFTEFHGLVEKIAGGLAARGIGKGDVVALFAPNLPQWAALFHGILRANATVTSANSMYTGGELAHQLTDSGATTLITVSPFLDRALAGATEAGLSADAVLTIDKAEGHDSLADLVSSGAPAPELTTTADDTAVLPYSSGTTGLAKGVILTHRNLVANLLQVHVMGSVTDQTKIMAFLPFFHIYGMTVMMNQGLHTRATVVTMPKFDLEQFLSITQKYAVDRLYIAPPVAVALAKHPIVDSYDLSCVKTIFSGAAPLDGELGRAVAKRLNCTVLQGYGMTELSPVSHCMPDDRGDLDLNSSGFALPNIECKLVDPESGKEVGVGERGELWVKGPNVMVGYLNNSDATDATKDADGYLHTGDIAVVDDEGVYSIVDRVKELIKYKGYQVPPAELEALLLTHDKIADTAVIGVKDAEGEEVPKAFVVKQASGADLTEDDVMAFVAEKVAPHKKVRVVEFIEQIPKSASGKILRKDLRARETEQA
ncbi:acyl-CoA synthetase (AMP-forming)/AMP-acid ligase II [Pseudonocardia autotrophica]|uniref:Long-chain-fatty-acid--CoA ligase n=2 Tax=Pseudonocardia TaxID=1847 RepID=A0A1Y2N9J3_PSEAH|nr:Long-chain-fatty-acid--CoA ligase [Pseudonocardia autotrophica]TDN74137.1 acyl-CoA synthetase (AMP-forming)/AMP-acid ligase II [Pseudonocardia autotrophica]